jgi:hypothetical protein
MRPCTDLIKHELMILPSANGDTIFYEKLLFIVDVGKMVAPSMFSRIFSSLCIGNPFDLELARQIGEVKNT